MDTGHWTLAQVPYSSTLSTVCILYAPRWFSPISARHPLRASTPFINFLVIVGVQQSGSLLALSTREFVPWTRHGGYFVACLVVVRSTLRCRICARYPGHTGHMPAGAIHVALATCCSPPAQSQPKVLATSNLWITGSKWKSTLRRHAS